MSKLNFISSTLQKPTLNSYIWIIKEKKTPLIVQRVFLSENRDNEFWWLADNDLSNEDGELAILARPETIRFDGEYYKNTIV